MKHTIKLLTLAAILTAVFGLTGCPGPVNNYIEPVWDNGVVTTAPTCTTEGVKTYHCSNGETRTETIPALSHNMGDWGEEWEVVIEPTTTSVGKKVKVRTCKREGCNYSEPWEETIPMLTSNGPSDTSNDDTSNDNTSNDSDDTNDTTDENETSNDTTEETQEHVHNYVGGGCDDINCDEHYEFNNVEDYQIEIRIVESTESIDTFVSLYFSFPSDTTALSQYSNMTLDNNEYCILLNDLIHMKPSYSSYSLKKIKIGRQDFLSFSTDLLMSLSELDIGSPIYVILE